jgi:hypothetical protein
MHETNTFSRVKTDMGENRIRRREETRSAGSTSAAPIIFIPGNFETRYLQRQSHDLAAASNGSRRPSHSAAKRQRFAPPSTLLIVTKYRKRSAGGMLRSHWVRGAR